MKDYECVVLEPNDLDAPLGLEATAKKWGLNSLDDIKIIQGSKHPFMEVTTMLLPMEVAANLNQRLLDQTDSNPGAPRVLEDSKKKN